MTKSLIEQIEQATSPDRELDLAIQLAIDPDGDIAKIVKAPRGLTGEEGLRWDIYHSGSVVFEKHDEHGRCFFNGGYPLPAYTASIDAALKLVPGHAIWTIEPAAAWVRVLDGDDVKEFQGFGTNGPVPTAAAIAIAALKSRDMH